MRVASFFVAIMSALLSAVPAASGNVVDEHAGSPVIVSAPASRETTYATPIAVVQPGDDLTFLNVETFPHTVRSIEMGPDDTPWCGPPNPKRPTHPKKNPRRFPIGKCPLLWTPPVSLTNGAIESKVYGTENLESGTTVDFYCTVFPNMTGTVIVI